MKKWLVLLVALVMQLGIIACAAEPEVACDLAYNMKDYRFFEDIFQEKADEQWDTMGRYTILLKGYHTPVIVEMDGRSVVSVSAYGYTKDVHIDTYQDEVNAQIQSAEAAILINENQDYKGHTWILTADGCYEFHPVGGISTQVRAREDGTMRYRRFWGEYDTTFHQDVYAPLYCCTARDHFLYETGTAKIVDGEVVLTAKETVTVSDEYDLEAMFAQAKAEGLFEKYDSVDECLAANKTRGTDIGR